MAKRKIRSGDDRYDLVADESDSWQDKVFRKWQEVPHWRRAFNRDYEDLYDDYMRNQDVIQARECVPYLVPSIVDFLKCCKEEGSGVSLDVSNLNEFHKALSHDFLVQMAALMNSESTDRQDTWKKKLDMLFQHQLFELFREAEEGGSVGVDQDDCKGMKATARSFSAPFVGNSHDRLWEHIASKDDAHERYANTCAIIQSSGTGKSRTVAELGQKCILISICLRYEDVGYPPADTDLRDYLILDTESPELARWRCFAVLIGLFQHTSEILKGMGASSAVDMRQSFYEKMSWSHGNEDDTKAYRQQFFRRVIKVADKYDKATRKSFHEDSPKRPSSQTIEDDRSSSQILTNSIHDLLETLNRAKGSGKSHAAKVVIAFDEAHILKRVRGVIKGRDGRERPWNTLTELEETFRACRNQRVWGLFLSTTGKIFQFNPPRLQDPSTRVVSQDLFTFPPFTALGYDIFAPALSWEREGRKVTMVDGSGTEAETSEPSNKKQRTDPCLTLDEITHVAFLVKFGRPMFSLRYSMGERGARVNILHFAMQKLICNDPNKVIAPGGQLNMTDQVALACLSQRICLEFDMSSYNVEEENQIAAHMRLCLKIGPDNQYIVSSSGSEPLLAEAAALIMMHKAFLPAHNLKSVFNGFGLSTGLRGETVAMLAVTVARDAVVHRKITEWINKHNGIKLSDVLAGFLDEDGFKGANRFRIVGVLAFLMELFKKSENIDHDDTSSVNDKSRSEREDKDENEYPEYRDEDEDEEAEKAACEGGEGEEIEGEKEPKFDPNRRLAGAYLYFNHFIKPTEQSTCRLECLMAYMTRGAALLCANNTPAVDFILPMLFGGAMLLELMSFVLVQVKNDRSITFKRDKERLFNAMDGTVDSLLEEDEEPKPVVRIVFSLLSEKMLHYQWKDFLVGKKKYRSLDIWCGGINFYHKKEPEASWAALLHTESKICKGAEAMIPGSAHYDVFWQWIPNLPSLQKPKDSKKRGKASDHVLDENNSSGRK